MIPFCIFLHFYINKNFTKISSGIILTLICIKKMYIPDFKRKLKNLKWNSNFFVYPLDSVLLSLDFLTRCWLVLYVLISVSIQFELSNQRLFLMWCSVAMNLILTRVIHWNNSKTRCIYRFVFLSVRIFRCDQRNGDNFTWRH